MSEILTLNADLHTTGTVGVFGPLMLYFIDIFLVLYNTFHVLYNQGLQKARTVALKSLKKYCEEMFKL